MERRMTLGSRAIAARRRALVAEMAVERASVAAAMKRTGKQLTLASLAFAASRVLPRKAWLAALALAGVALALASAKRGPAKA